MNKKQKEAAEKHLLKIIGAIHRGEVEWWAISVKFKTYRIAIHSEGAPKRPRGLA